MSECVRVLVIFCVNPTQCESGSIYKKFEDVMKRGLYSYLNEMELYGWDGKRPLVVFDGVCVLCSFFARWIVARDKEGAFMFTTAQSRLGQALYQHYDLDRKDFETNLVIINGELHEKMYGALAVCAAVGYPWRAFAVLQYLPQGLLNSVYSLIAKNRYMIFGKKDQCEIASVDLRQRLVGFDG